ncbi:unnamed protein product [Symbiodinium sp. CCMP2592]|nr:unnamed protein product [Symbiodinium sp. CCMP2592]
MSQTPGPVQEIRLQSTITLNGIVEMERATALPGLLTHVRPQRIADECQGAWVHVKKHSNLSIAVVQFPNSKIRDVVWQQSIAADGRFADFPSIRFDMKPHQEKVEAGGKREVPGALFVAWKGGNPIIARDLQCFFDRITAPMMEAFQPAGASVADVLLQGKRTLGPYSGTGSSGEDVVVLRLTRMARSPQVINLLLQSPVLEPCHERVRNSGCGVSPTWANGAKILVPGILAQDVHDAGVTLQDHHVLVYSSEIELVRRALAAMPCRERPKVAHHQDMGKMRKPRMPDADEPDFVVECSLRTYSSFGPNSTSGHCDRL